MDINLKEKSIVELKAIAHDLIVTQQNIANSLNIVYKELEFKTEEAKVLENTVLNQEDNKIE